MEIKMLQIEYYLEGRENLIEVYTAALKWSKQLLRKSYSGL